MEAFQNHSGIVAPLDQANINTDVIMPKDFIKRIERTGYGQFLFYHWKYDSLGNKNEDFVLNNPIYTGASILLARKNFGCGSSREHAPWGIQDFGFKAIIAPSFGDIFYNNCLKIGLLPIVLTEVEVDELFRYVLNEPGVQLDIDLEKQLVINPKTQKCYSFEIDSYNKNSLLNGLDEIDLTLQNEQYIKAFEENHSVFFSLLKEV